MPGTLFGSVGIKLHKKKDFLGWAEPIENIAFVVGVMLNSRGVQMKIFFLICIFFQGGSAAQAPTLTTTRSVFPDTIYSQGSSNLPNKTTVTITVSASGDSIITETGLDILLLVDNTASLGFRNVGDRNWTNPSQIQAIYNALVTFLDSSVTTLDRVSLIRWARCIETVIPFTTRADDPGFTQSKIKIDQMIDGNDVVGCTTACFYNTALWYSMIEGIKYFQTNKRPGANPVIIFMTDGLDNASTRCYNLAFSDAVAFIDSIPEDEKPLVYTINIGFEMQAQLQNISARTGAQSFTTQINTDLTDTLLEIIKIIPKPLAIIAKEIHPIDYPLLIDILGPDIHFLGGFSDLGNKKVSSWNLDSSGTFQRLNISIPQVEMADTVVIQYDIIAELGTGSLLPTPMRTTNLLYHVNDDSSQASRVFYYQGDSVLTWAPLGGNNATANFVFVLGAPTSFERLEPKGNRNSFSLTPNPFNPTTSIRFLGNAPSEVRIYDLKGRLIRSWNSMQALVIWNGLDINGREVGAGTFIVRVKVGETAVTKRLVLMR